MELQQLGIMTRRGGATDVDRLTAGYRLGCLVGGLGHRKSSSIGGGEESRDGESLELRIGLG